MIKVYTVKDIEEADFGCEGLPDGQVLKDKVTLTEENGDTIIIEAEDAYLYKENIDVGDKVTYDDTKEQSVLKRCD